MTFLRWRTHRRPRRLQMCARAVGVLLFSVLAAGAVSAQPGVPPVAFARAIESDVRATLELTGTVVSRRSSVVASEIAGVVTEIAAREGDRVRRGHSLVRLRRRNPELRLESARGELKEAEARLRLAEAGRERAQGLFDEEIISLERLDDAVSEYEARLGRVEQLRAEVDRLEEDLARTTIRAPFSGAVVRELVAEGEWIAAGGAVAEMVDTENLELDLELPERFFGAVRPEEKVSVSFDELGLTVEGKVRAVVPSANAQARTFPVKVALTNKDGQIGVGMLARAALSVGTARTEVLVPKDAVVGAGAGSAVFVLDDSDHVTRVPVRTGSARGSWIAISGEVEPGARVVTLGNERLMPGQQVAPEAAEYARPATSAGARSGS